MSVCSLSYPACNAHAPYYLWSVRLYSIFHTVTQRAPYSEKKLLNTKYVFGFSLQLLSEISLILRRTERDVIRNVYRSACKVRVFLVRLWWNLNLLQRFFEKYSNFKFHENSSSGSWAVPCGRTDRHDEANNSLMFFWPCIMNWLYINYTSQQDFGTRKVYCVSNVTFHAESKYAIKIFPSPTVFIQWLF